MSILLREASSVTIPGVLLPQTADSGFLENIGLKDNKLEFGNTSVNITTINPINTPTTISQTWHSDREKQGYNVGNIKIPAYVVNAHYEYDKKEAGIFSKNVEGLSLQNLLSSLCVQAINQRLRQGVFHGLGLNEGILAHATTITFGQDENQKTKLTEMNPTFVLKKLMNMINQAMSATLNRGDKIVITSSLRVINYLNLTIVPLADFLKGGGTQSITSTISDVVRNAFGIECKVVIDSTFESSTADTISVVIPSIKASDESEFSMNYAGKQNNINANTFLDVGNGAINELNPEMNGYVSGNFTMALTSGVSLRSEAVYTTSIQYE